MRITARCCARLASRFEARCSWGAASRSWREALAHDDRRADWYYRWGRVLERQGNLTGAAYAYRAAITRDPRTATWHYRLGQVLRKTGEWAAARQAHREAERRAGPRREPEGAAR